MLIDWFTVGAQILNFLVLLILLKIFLFDRIVQAMDERQAKINSRFEAADRRQKQAREKAQSLEEEKRKLDEKRRQLIEEARQDAEAQRKQWSDQARREVDELQAQWTQALDKQKKAFGRELRHLAAEQVYAVSRRALKDLADVSLEERILEGFLSRLAEMDRAAKKKFKRSPDNQNGSATVRSAFELSTRMRQKVTRTLHQELAEDLEVEYATDADMLAGIELKAAGKKICWSLDAYLQTLEENVIKAIEAQTDQDKGGGQAESQGPSDKQPGDSAKNEQRSD